MVRPGRFSSNPATLASNRFQQPADAARDTHASALREFDGVGTSLARHGVRVHVVPSLADLELPDEIFPNNWLSLHADGTAVLYPLMAETRRPERRRDVLERLCDLGYRIERVVDLSTFERQAKYLEGTGSMVLDHTGRRAYACLSQRTDPDVLAEFGRALGYEPFVFEGLDRRGVPIYHTNVMLAIGAGFAVVCAAAVRERGTRMRLLESLEAGGREIIELSFAQIEAFAGNLLALEGADGPLIGLSTRALESLGDTEKELLAAHGTPIAANVETIENYGGGSIRCMLAEVFLPRA